MITDLQLNGGNRRAVFNLHIGCANQAAYTAAAPAGVSAAVVLNDIAGNGTIGKLAGRIVFAARKTHQAANAVPFFPGRVCSVVDLNSIGGGIVRIENNVLHNCAGGNAEQAHAFRVRGNLHVLNGIGMPVIGRRKRRHFRNGTSLVAVGIEHAADGGIVGNAFLLSVQVVGLLPGQGHRLIQNGIVVIAPQQVRETVISGFFVLFRNLSSIRYIPIMVVTRHRTAVAQLAQTKIGFLRTIVPVDILQLLHRPNLVAVGSITWLILPCCNLVGPLGVAVIADGLGKEGADGIPVGSPVIGQVPACVFLFAGQVEPCVPGAGGVGPEAVTWQLLLQFLFHRRVGLAYGTLIVIRKADIINTRPHSRRLHKVPVSISGNHTAVVVVIAQVAAGEGGNLFVGSLGGAQVVQVVALVGAAGLVLPVENTQGAQVLFLVGPVAEVGVAAVGEPDGGGVGIGIGFGLGSGMVLGVRLVRNRSEAGQAQASCGGAVGVGPELVGRGIEAIEGILIAVGAAI